MKGLQYDVAASRLFQLWGVDETGAYDYMLNVCYEFVVPSFMVSVC